MMAGKTQSQKEKNKQAIQNINKTGTVSGTPSGVSNISSSKIVKDTTNTSNLSGVNQQKQSAGTARVAQTKTSAGTPSTNREIGKTFVQSASTPVTTDLKKAGGEYKSDLKKVAESGKTNISLNQATAKEYTPDVNYKSDYTYDDVKRLNDDFQKTLVESPFTNPDVEYKGESYDQFRQDLANKQSELKVAETKTALNKEIADANKEGDLDINDVVQNVDGQVQLIDYRSEIAKKAEENDALKAELEQLENQVFSQPMNTVGAMNVTNLSLQVKALRDKIKENEGLLSDLERRAKYQNAVQDSFAYDYAIENKDLNVLKDLESIHASYDDTWIERRLNNVGKSTVEGFTAITSVVDIALDLGGEEIAKVWTKGAEQLRDNGTISNEQFNDMVEVVKPLIEFDANDTSLMSYQFRKLSAQLEYEIANGADEAEIWRGGPKAGPIMTFIGQGLDSTENFLAQMLMYGSSGSLAVMSGLSGSQKYFENIEKGYDKNVAFLNGLATGMASYFTEKMGMDNFGEIIAGQVGKGIFAQAGNAIVSGKSPLSFWAQSIVSQAVAEGLEEVVEGNVDFIIDSLTAKIANGEPVEYNAGDIFMSMLIGAFSGGLTGAVGGLSENGAYNIALNTKKQYNALKMDVNSLQQMRREAISKGQDTSMVDRAIRAGTLALNNFEGKSPLVDAVDLPQDEVAPNLDPQGVNGMLTEALEPNVEQDVQTEMEKEALINNVMKTTEDMLSVKGIDMDAGEFVDLDDATRTKLLDEAEKINSAFPNASIGYSTAIGDNAMVIKMQEGKPRIIVNPYGDTSVVVSTLHEAVHTIEDTDGYQELFDLVFPTVEDFRNKFNELSADRYSGDNFNTIKNETLTVALTEDLLGEEGSQAFIDHMAKYNTSTAYKLFYNLKNATGIFKDNSTLGRITNELTKALDKLDIAYTATGVEYSKAPTRKQIDYQLNHPRKMNEDSELGRRLSESQIPLKESPNEKIWWEESVFGENYNVMATIRRGAINSTQYDYRDPSTNVYRTRGHSYGIDRRTGQRRTPKDPIDRWIVRNTDILYKHPFAVINGSEPGSFLLVTKATTKLGAVIVLPIYPNKVGNYIDIEARYRPEQTITTVSSEYGKNNPSYSHRIVRGVDVYGLRNYDILNQIDEIKESHIRHCSYFFDNLFNGSWLNFIRNQTFHWNGFCIQFITINHPIEICDHIQFSFYKVFTFHIDTLFKRCSNHFHIHITHYNHHITIGNKFCRILIQR